MRGILKSFAAGAALMYFFDPSAGRRRRIIFRDKTASKLRGATNFLRVAGRDFKHRFFGAFAELRYRLTGARRDDDLLVRRAAAAMGHYVSHPRAISITCNDGVATVSGPILRSEVDMAIAAIQAIPGIRSVNNQLEAHEQPGNVHALQGGRVRMVPREQREFWNPSQQLLGYMAGGYLLISGRRRGGMSGLARLLIGGGLLLRAASNKRLTTLLEDLKPAPGKLEKGEASQSKVSEAQAV